MAFDREVGGIRCFEVLEHLSDYVDDDVSVELRERIETHLQGCDWCERFGNQFSEVVGAVRCELGKPAATSAGRSKRILTRLNDEPSR
jgi:anti-sigma factor RsiW